MLGFIRRLWWGRVAAEFPRCSPEARESMQRAACAGQDRATQLRLGIERERQVFGARCAPLLRELAKLMPAEEGEPICWGSVLPRSSIPMPVGVQPPKPSSDNEFSDTKSVDKLKRISKSPWALR